MKKVLIALLFMVATVAAAQTPYKRSGNGIEIDGEKLSEAQMQELLSDVNGTDIYGYWNKEASSRKLGTGLAIGGGVLTAAGLASALLGGVTSLLGAATGAVVGSVGGQEGASSGASQGAKAGKPFAVAGLVAAAAGLGTLTGGIVLISKSNKRLDGLVDLCNSASGGDIQVMVGPAPSGIGLCMNF